MICKAAYITRDIFLDYSFWLPPQYLAELLIYHTFLASDRYEYVMRREEEYVGNGMLRKGERKEDQGRCRYTVACVGLDLANITL